MVKNGLDVEQLINNMKSDPDSYFFYSKFVGIRKMFLH